MHIGARIIQRMWCQYPAEAKVPGTILKEEPTFAVLQSFKPQRITKVVWVVRQKKGNENNDHDISWWISWIVKGISLESLSPEWEYVLGFKVWFTTPCWELTNLPWGKPFGAISNTTRASVKAFNIALKQRIAALDSKSLQSNGQYSIYNLRWSHTQCPNRNLSVYRSKMRFIQTSLNFTMSSGFELF